MSTFAPATALPAVAPLDPTKHVNYTLGMVLGVEDFTQEFAYLSNRDRWLARDLIGYGTVWGLKVSVEAEPAGEALADARVKVARGTALSPCGQLICVGSEQCASINAWLAAHQDKLAQLPGVNQLPLYLVVCYREALSDDIPIPGEPCRCDDDLVAQSRVQDCFRLELRLAPPPQCEEQAVRDFVWWMRGVRITDGPDYVSETEFLDVLRAAAQGAAPGSPPEGSPPEPGSPPVSSPPASSLPEGWTSPPEGGPPCPPGFAYTSPPASVAIPREYACDYMHAAYRVWCTELRPALRWPLPSCDCGCSGPCGCGSSAGCNCGGSADPCQECEDAVLLAELSLPVEWQPGGHPVLGSKEWTIEESQRPYLMHLRMLQELLPCGEAAGGAGRKGDKGDQGAQGIQGAQGVQGDPGPPGPSTVVAAGRFEIKAGLPGNQALDLLPARYRTGGLKARRLRFGFYLVSWNKFDRKRHYVIKGVPLILPGDPPHTYEVIDPLDIKAVATEFKLGNVPFDGILLRIVPTTQLGGNPVLTHVVKAPAGAEARGFEIEISDYTDLPEE